MANPYDVYRDQRQTSWTRVDMVLALYDEALKRIDESTQALDRDDQIDARKQCLRIIQVIACLRSGVDPDAGKLPENLLRLFNFVDQCATSGKRADLDAARNVLVPIRDSFEEIRNTAAALEREGTIPALQIYATAGRSA